MIKGILRYILEFIVGFLIILAPFLFVIIGGYLLLKWGVS